MGTRIGTSLAAATAGLALLAVSGTASAATTQETFTAYCRVPTSTELVPINDLITRQQDANGWIRETHVLTDPATGTTLTYSAKFRFVPFPDSDEGYYAGPAIVDVGEIDYGIYYLKGRATIAFAGGGYTASKSANHIIDVCAEFGYTSS